MYNQLLKVVQLPATLISGVAEYLLRVRMIINAFALLKPVFD